MRNNIYCYIFTGIVLLFACSNTSCKKNNDNPAPATFTGYFKGKVDGVAFHYTSEVYYGCEAPDLCFSKIISVSFSTGTIRLWCPLEAGEYIFNDTKMYAASIWYGSGSDERYHAGSPLGFGIFKGSGRISVLEASANHIKGTFEFTGLGGPLGTSSKIVTEGEFSVTKS